MECKSVFQLTVLPIFYNVTPSDVRHQRKSFAKAFAKHERRFPTFLTTSVMSSSLVKTLFFFSFPVSMSYFYLLQYSSSEKKKGKVVRILLFLVLFFFFFFVFFLFLNRDRKNIKGNVEKVHKWRKALEDAASISGYEILDAPDANEADSVQWVVDEILDQLVYNKSKPEEKLVNIDALIREVNLLFCKEDVRVVGIWGMGGSGKTTLARAFFDRYSSQFKHKVFLANIREVTQKDGAEHLQSNLISEILKSKSIRVKDVCEGANMIKDRLCKKKVLLILDDVDNKCELDALAGSTSWFGKGSKVIITTRNRKLLTKPEVDATYVVNLLLDDEALQLFSLHAFNQAIPAEGFEELSHQVIDYAKGLPLALKVLGSFLYNRDVLEWISTIERLNIIPEEGISEDAIVETLKISYDGLKDSWIKEMFLDIACFFRWWREYEVKEILDRFYSNSAIGLSILKERSLIYISCGVIEIHDLIEEMGHRIVRETHRDEPWKHSRLWKEAEVSNVLMGCMDKGNIQAICLDYFFPEHVKFSGDSAFTGMHRLRLLRIFGGKFPRGLEYLPSELKSLYWSRYPLETLPNHFLGRKLVALEMPYGKISRLWEGVKCCFKLEIIDLSHCQKLVETPDFKMIPHLKKLILRNCRSLREVHHSVEFLNELILLDLESCQNLVHLPGCIWRLINSRILDLSHFSMLKNLPEVLGYMDCLWILEKLKLFGCYKLAILPHNIWRLKNLETFDIRHCLKLKKLPEFPEKMYRLLKLKLDWSGIRELPSSVMHLSSLRYLGLEGCRNLATLPTNIWKLKKLEILNLSECSRLEKLPEILETLDCLRHLMLNNSGIRELPSSIYHLRGLICLDLTLCGNLATLPKDIWRLKKLKFLYLSQCSKLEKLPEIEGDIAYSSVLEILDLSNSENLVCLPSTIGRFTNLKILKLSGCLVIEEIPEGLGDLDQLKELHADDTAIQCLPSSITRLNTLEFLSLRKKLFTHRQVSSSFVFPRVSTGFRSLVSLDLSHCSLIEGGFLCNLECLSSLVSLNLSGNNFLFLPDISRLCCLRFLDVTYCHRLHALPELPPRIKELYADARLALMSIPKFSSKYKDLDVISFIDDAERDVPIYQENQSWTYKRRQICKESIQFSAHLERSQWHSAREGGLRNAKLQMESSPIIRNIPEVHASIFRNYSKFRRSYELMERVLKVYVYREGEKPIFHQPYLRGIYASEGWFMKLMEKNKQFLVKDPKRAHLFYLPFSSLKLREALSKQNFTHQKDLENHLSNYIGTISRKYHFWNRSSGADHFFVACHDWAPRLTRKNMETCIRVLCNSNIAGGFKIGKDVSLPVTYVRSAENPLKDLGGNPPSARPVLAFFAGGIHGYLRPILLQHWSDKEPDMKIFGPMPRDPEGKAKYRELMKSSKYCICARGYEVHTPRVVESIHYECVPVIISDNYVPPFFEVFDWESFSVFILEKDVPDLRNILLSIPEEKYMKMQHRLKIVQQYFLWHKNPVKYDLFHMILHSIWYNRVFQVKSK